MYVIRHLPSKTYYGVYDNCKVSTSNSKVILFRKYKDAKKIADSLVTYYDKHKLFPDMNKLCYYDKSSSIYKDSLDSDLWIYYVNKNEFMKNNCFWNVGSMILEKIDGSPLVCKVSTHVTLNTFQETLKDHFC